MSMKILERSKRYMGMFKVVAPMQEALTQIKALESEIDVLRSAMGIELEDNADLIAFYADKVESLVVDVDVLIDELSSWVRKNNITVNKVSKINKTNWLDKLGCDIPEDDGIEGVELTEHEVHELLAGLVEDEHESI